jgi:4-hydroxy-3-methylbut-2-enyl diphosphate reductase
MTFLIVFSRSVLLDIQDIQGDRLVGKETIPIVLGSERTLQILMGSTGILTVLFIAAPLNGWLHPVHVAFLIGVAYLVLGKYLITGQRIVRRFLSESLVDGTFFVFGAIALITMLVGH